MTQSGWRKPTPGLLQAERFAEVGERLIYTQIPGHRRGEESRGSDWSEIPGPASSRYLWGGHTAPGLGAGQAAHRLGVEPFPDGADRVLARHAQTPCKAAL